MKTTLHTMLSLAFLASTQVGLAQCSQPSNLNAVQLTTTSTQLSWSEVQDANNYRVQYRIQGLTAWNNVQGLTATTTTLTGLQVNTIYEWRVKGDCSTYSSVAVFNSGGSGNNTSCSQPSNLVSNVLSTTSVSLSWSAIPEAFNYRVRYRVEGTNGWTILPPVVTNSYVLSGLLPNTNYQWRVKASCSTSSSPAPFTTTPGGGSSCSAPSNTNVVEVLATSASVEWEPVTEAVDYTVEVRTPNSAYQVVGTTTSSFIDITGLQPGTDYLWRVKASCSPFGSDVQFSTPQGRSLMVSDATTIPVLLDLSSGLLTAQTSAMGGNLLLMDAAGRMVLSVPVNSAITVMQVGSLPAGMYVVRELGLGAALRQAKVVVSR